MLVFSSSVATTTIHQTVQMLPLPNNDSEGIWSLGPTVAERWCLAPRAYFLILFGAPFRPLATGSPALTTPLLPKWIHAYYLNTTAMQRSENLILVEINQIIYFQHARLTQYVSCVRHLSCLYTRWESIHQYHPCTHLLCT